MTTFVLVHGAWHGGWCWRRVESRLRSEGHDVFVPTLTGLGERSHLASPDIDLARHVEDVVEVIDLDRLREVVLVGHSYGGMVITGAADRRPDTIGALVYLDAYVPENGDSMQDLTDTSIAAARAEIGARTGYVPPVRAAEFDVNAADRDWVDAMCVPQPAATITQPLILTGGIDRCDAARVYVLASRGAPGRAFPALADRLRARPEWTVCEIEAGHDVMIDAPAELTSVLSDLAAHRG